MANTNSARRSLKPAPLADSNDDNGGAPLDLSAFAPKPKSEVTKSKTPDDDTIRKFSEGQGFTSRSKADDPSKTAKPKTAAKPTFQPAAATVSSGRRNGRPRSKVQRNVQCNTRVQEITMQELLWYYEAEGWSYAQVLEHSLDALREKREGQGLLTFAAD